MSSVSVLVLAAAVPLFFFIDSFSINLFTYSSAAKSTSQTSSCSTTRRAGRTSHRTGRGGRKNQDCHAGAEVGNRLRIRQTQGEEGVLACPGLKSHVTPSGSTCSPSRPTR